MKAFLKTLGIQFRMDLRDRGILMNYYLVPLVFFFVVGSVFSSINPQMKQTLAASMSIFAVTMGAVMGAPIPIVKARESGTLRAFRVNGIPDAAVLAVHALSAFLHLMIVSAIIFAAAPAVLHARVPGNPAAFFAVLLLFLCASVGVGVAVGTSARGQSAATMFSMLIFLPTVLFSGIMFPLSLLPQAFRWVSFLFPATHAMQAFLGFAYGLPADFSPAAAAWVLAGMGAAALVVSVRQIGSIRRA